MRIFKLLCAMLVMPIMVYAVPAKKEWRLFTQPDGSTIELMLVGDENYHYFLTRDQVPVVEEENERFCYARNVGFAMKSTGVLAHEADMRTDMDRANIYSLGDTGHNLRFARMKGLRKMRHDLSPRNTAFFGKKKGLIILANFSDNTFWDYTESDNGLTTWERYDELANKEGYVNGIYGAIGSVHDYFINQSYGKFDLSFDVVGPVTLENTISYYGTNLGGDDYRASQMIYHACQKVDSLVDFNDYDWNGDGVVEEVFVLYAGYGEATGGRSDTVWPHMWSLASAAQTDADIPQQAMFDGCQVDIYACSNELYSRNGNTEMGIGVICHEFSHCLGLPDLYDTSYVGNFGMGMWDLLDEGCYNGPAGLGWVPAGYSSYERSFAGWLDWEELKDNKRVVDQKPLNELGDAYVIYNDGNRNEYYLLENRNQTGWDSYLPASGLLVIHVDYDSLIWELNTVNTTGKDNSHQRLTVFHASNSDRGGHETYPYLGNDSLTDYSTPSAILYNENIDGSLLMHKPITEITRNEDDGAVSFLFTNNNNTNAISKTSRGENEDVVGIYSLDGIRVATSWPCPKWDVLPSGIYIVKKWDGSSVKITLSR